MSLVGVDVKDLYYTMAKLDLFVVVIKKNNGVNYQNKSGVPVERFFELLEFSLRSACVEVQGHTYVQREGICIGSAVHHGPNDIHLAKCNRAIERTLNGKDIIKVCRYANDFLILQWTEYPLAIPQIFEVFAEN